MEFLCEIEPSLAKELKLCKCHPFYMADLHTKQNEVKKKSQGKNVAIIEARTVLFGFQGQL